MLDLDGIDHSRVQRIAGRLVGQKETIAISESSAGGLISAAGRRHPRHQSQLVRRPQDAALAAPPARPPPLPGPP